MRHERRLRKLEAKCLSESVTLYFADGSTRQISGNSHFLLNLLADACRADLSPMHAATLKLIGESVSAWEPSGGRLVEVLRLVQNGPLEPDRNETSAQLATSEEIATLRSPSDMVTRGCL
jgi:hypothetical protein